MVSRIERVAHIKSAGYDVNRSFERKEGYQEQQEKRKFSEVLQGVMGSRDAEVSRMDPMPYMLDLQLRATQSLFYQDGVKLRSLEERINATG